MGNRRLYKSRCIHTLDVPGSERLKVTALNLFHPTASPIFEKVGFFILRHNLWGERGRVRGTRIADLRGKFPIYTNVEAMVYAR